MTDKDNLKDEEKYKTLRLENQICFPLYACSKEVIRIYKPILEEFDLTYTQYITMMVIWEEKEITVKEIGDRLFLDSGTLTPLLKKLEQKGYIKRNRSVSDERNLIISLTNEGLDLRERALEAPKKFIKNIEFDKKKARDMYFYLYELLEQLRKKGE